MRYQSDKAFARQADSNDPLREFRGRFRIPLHHGKEVLYFCGNSLGLQPKTAAEALKRETEDWASLAVEGHFKARRPWFPYHEFLRDQMAAIAGALPKETVVMNSLTANLHLLMVSMYRPTAKRYKILCEWTPFPSDRYVLQSQADFHARHVAGMKKEDAVIELRPPDGEYQVPRQQVLDAIRAAGDELAMVMIGGVNYYTGQLYDIPGITEAAHASGAVAGFDLAHAAGNVELQLHDWNVDFAAWCTYKYLNAGPGSVGGAFVHEKHAVNRDLPRFAGWWGNDPETRFTMPQTFVPVPAADSWQLSNAPVFSMAVLKESLQVFADAGMNRLAAKSRQLTGYLEFLIREWKLPLRIITPSAPGERGCQLSLIVEGNGKKLYTHLADNGVIADWRQPDVIRVAPVPLYNSFTDVFLLAEKLREGITVPNHA